MASTQSAHDGSAQTTEFDIDLVDERIRGRSPDHARAVVSVDANSTFRVEIEAANQYDWQLDARIVDGALDVGRVFCEGDHVREDDVAKWVKRVAGVVGERLEGSR